MCEEALHDPFTDQVECARFRAERDMLAQTMERVADDIEQTFLGFEGAEDAPAMRWAREFRSALGSLHAPVRDTTMSARDLLPEEEREAIAWVREHGGLDEVNRKVAESMQQADEYIALRCSLAERAGDLYEMLDKEDDELVSLLDKRLMPVGMEWLVEAWPRFEDDAPVCIGDEISWKDDGGKVNSIELQDGGYFILHAADGAEDWILPQYFPGERVRRPAVAAADGDGCCEPGTYRCHEVAFTCDSCGHTVFVDKCMVDEIRYLRAKGIRTLNCCCGHGEKAEPFIIVNEGDECRMLNMGYERRVNKHGVTYFTPKSACPPKFIAADGKPLLKHETVYEIKTGERYFVTNVFDGMTEPDFPEHTVECRKHEDVVTHMFKPSQLTHERPDSWERLEEDVAGASCPDVYCANHHIDASDTSYEWAMARDIVRRAKALAGVSE